MSQVSLKLKIATHLMAALMNQDRNRRLNDRLEDIRHSLDVAAALIREDQGQSAPAGDLTLEPRPAIRTRATLVDRDPPPLQDLIDERRSSAAPRAPKGPTRH